jgi:hypothetical protein
MRRLRAGFANPRPGRPGSPSAPTTGSCLQWLDVGPDEGGRKPAGSGGSESLCPSPEARPRGAKSPRWSAERRRALRKRRARRKAWTKMVRLSALRPLACREGKNGRRNPAPRKQRGGGALAKRPAGCLKTESNQTSQTRDVRVLAMPPRRAQRSAAAINATGIRRRWSSAPPV